MANCPSCHRYFAKKMDAIDHINKYHSLECDERHWTAAQWLYASTHNNDINGKCMICGKPTEWSDKSMKPYKLCGNPKCRAAVKAQYDKNRDAKLHMSQSELMSNMDHQREMLSHRKIAGRYKFQDGGEVEYVAKLELNFLQFCDRILELKSQDVLPSPDVFTYFDPKDGKDHSYVPDFYFPQYNMLVEIKDKANGNPAFLEETRYKVALKDDAMKKQSKYNYIRISGTNYGPFMEILFKITHGDDKDEPNRKNIIMISESSNHFYNGWPLVMVSYYPDNSLKAISISQSMSTWYMSNFDDQDLVQVEYNNPVFDNTMYRVFRYAGEYSYEKFIAALGFIRARAVNPNNKGEWNILEIFKTSGLHFDDLNGTSNNQDRQSDFELVDAGYRGTIDKEETE